MMRMSLVVALGLLNACGAPVEEAEQETSGEQSEALGLICTAYAGAQRINRGSFSDCPTRPFQEVTSFTFTNLSGKDTTVWLSSGPDVYPLSVAARPATTWWWHRYYGGLVRIAPTQDVLVSLK